MVAPGKQPPPATASGTIVPEAIDPHLFVQLVWPALRSGKPDDVVQTVLARWQPTQVCRLLGHEEVDIRRTAAVTLGLIGDQSTVDCLLQALHDPDTQVNQLAEHSLWSLWFRSGDPRAVKPFCQGVAMIAQDRYDLAVEHFLQAQAIDPEFSEAYNQCAVAYFFLQQWTDSLSHCLQAVERVPRHFGALAGMGHCYTELKELDRALACYRHAIAINPGMSIIQMAIDRLEAPPRK